MKALENLKSAAEKCNFSCGNKDNETLALISLLKDFDIVTLSIFESLLCSISVPSKSEPNSWSLLSSLKHTKKVTNSLVAEESEFAQVDSVLQSFLSHKTRKCLDMNNLNNQLES